METKNVFDIINSSEHETEEKKAVELVCKIKNENVAIYNKAIELQKFLAVGGFWKGYYIGLGRIITTLLEVESILK